MLHGCSWVVIKMSSNFHGVNLLKAPKKPKSDVFFQVFRV